MKHAIIALLAIIAIDAGMDTYFDHIGDSTEMVARGDGLEVRAPMSGSFTAHSGYKAPLSPAKHMTYYDRYNNRYNNRAKIGSDYTYRQDKHMTQAEINRAIAYLYNQ